MKYAALVLLVFTGLLSMSSSAQGIKTPPPSAPQTVRQDFGLGSVELSYSRPGIKGRKIFGDLVPFGKVWRTGANQATTLTFTDDVTIGGTKIPAGKYGLLTIPDVNTWTIIITKQLDVTNPVAYKADQDVVRLKAEIHQLPFAVENFTILFADMTASSCNLQFIWDNVLVAFPINTEVDSKIMKQIDNAMTRDNHPYFASAQYYLDNGKDLNKALEWLDKAIAQDPTAYYVVYQKARCLAKLGRKQEAITTAKKSIDLSRTANNADYVALNEKLLTSLQ